MPTKRRPLERRRRAPPIEEAYWEMLNDRPYHHLDPLAIFTGKEELRALWLEYGPIIVNNWAHGEQHGRRPSHWWRWSVPRVQPEMLPERLRCEPYLSLPEPRAITGGANRPSICWEHNLGGDFRLGIPPYVWGNPDDPPKFETQWQFLHRHALLIDDEQPADDEPEVAFKVYDVRKSPARRVDV